jgi:hypothetical protein
MASVYRRFRTEYAVICKDGLWIRLQRGDYANYLQTVAFGQYLYLILQTLMLIRKNRQQSFRQTKTLYSLPIRNAASRIRKIY